MKNYKYLLDNISLDRNIKIALYKQLYYELKKIIENRKIPDGEFFYSENDIMTHFGVSRITVRQAFQLLETDGLIQRSQGNSSVVTQPTRFLWDFHELTDDLYRFGSDLETKLISAEIIQASDVVKENLQLTSKENLVYRLERLRTVNEINLAYSISYLNASLSIDLDKIKEVENVSIRKILKENDENPVYSSEIIEAVNADVVASNYLELPENHAVFFRKRITFSENDKPLEYVESYYNSNVASYYSNKKLLSDDMD